MERIHVTVRARPLSAEEAKSSPWRISGSSVFIPNQPAKFDFDRVFGEESTTGEVYGARTKEIVAAAVRGFNGTVFAYGQTNSGKTHTMRGSVTEPGVIPRAVSELFDMIEEDADREFLLRMSYMEIYNEDINDLLAPEHRKLQIHENLERGIYVAGLREEIVVSQEQVLELMRFGESHRHIGETNMNTYSSRSHTIFRMIIESRDKIEDDNISGSCDAVRVSVLNLVDLAGSERAAKTGAEGVRLIEGSHINKSLMTLGTVIQKLSEGAESQGGHVPYRDSKLTRILQPALGGNANTAIICNITLAQIHADETKSSLQFASRALRVTNHAHVNEILTDAALLKRQKKEIEELREKLQGSRSEHLEKEILNLRNTLLQSELERERISLELEEEKRVQAEREKVLQEQAKKIKNLSSMVLCFNRDENLDQIRKGKRRDTWCPSNLSRQTVEEVDIDVQPMVSAVKPSRLDHGTGPLLPFEEVLNELELRNNFFPQHEPCDSNAPTNCNVPEPRALLHVTSRRKVPSKKKGPPTENHNLLEMQAAYEELYLKSETQKTVSHVKIDCLTRQLAEANVMACPKEDDSFSHLGCRSVDQVERGTRESDAILVIKQLQEKIKMLEMEKSASQQNLDNVVELATDQNELAREKLEELLEELQKAQEEARIAHEWLVNDQSTTTNELAEKITEFVSEIQSSKETVHSVFSLIHDMFQTLSSTSDIINEFKALMCSSFSQEKMVFHDHEIFRLSISKKAAKLEGEKVALHSHLTELQGQLEELRQDSQKQIESLEVLLEQHELEKEDCISQIQILQNEISCLSNCSLFKEKESLRKDLEKAKSKLKETESKMKNTIQEKTKLEGEKAVAEKKISRLQGQNSLLECDIYKRESLAGRRRDSVMERGPKVSVPKNALAAGTSFEQTMQEDYQKLDVLLFEMEATIASLEEQVTEANKDRDEALCKNEGLMLEIDVLSKELKASSTELNALREEVSGLRLKLEESTSEQKRSEDFIKSLSEEKEELALQLADALLEIEEERTIWSAKETGSISVINEQAKLHKSEITSLFEKMSEVKHQFESCKEECNALRERVADNDKYAGGKKCRVETFTEVDLIMENQGRLDDASNESKQLWEAKVQVDELNRRISAMKAMMHEADIINGKVKAKIRMRLKGTQAKLDAFRLRHNEVVDETAFMNKKFEDASEKLKGMVASLGKECLNLKKQLAACRCHSSS